MTSFPLITLSYVSHLDFDQIHDGEQHLHFLPRFTPVDREEHCISLYDERDDYNFHFTSFLFLSSHIRSSIVYEDDATSQ